MAVSLDAEDLVEKMVTRRRGGICFEHTLLLRHALEALGIESDIFLARVRLGSAPAATRPRSHPVLRVRDGGETWLVDVGFGTGGLLEPLALQHGAEKVQAGWRLRIVEDGPEMVLQQSTEGGWADIYGFVPEPQPMVEIEVSSWFTSTYTGSRFVTGLCVARHWTDGRRAILSDWNGELSLTEAEPKGEKATPVPWSAVPGLLESRFELPGFALGDEGRIVAEGAGAGQRSRLR